MTINNCTITGSKADTGAAIFNSGNLILKNTIITDNHATTEGGALFNYHNSSKVNNCSIFNNTASQGADISLYRTTTQSNYDDNWWGVNNPLNTTDYPLDWDKRFQKDYDGNIKDPETWLNINTETNDNTLTVTLANQNNQTTNLPLNVNIETKIEHLNTILENGVSTVELKQTEENQTIKTTVDYQINYNTLKGTLNNTILTILTSENLAKKYGDETPLKGKLTDSNINPIAGQHITITLSRQSNSQSKTYDVVTDYNGAFTLPINLANGEYISNIKYDGITLGNTTYKEAGPITRNILITENTPTNTSSYTYISLEKYNQTVSTKTNLIGHLTNFDTTPLAGQHVKITLSRTSGASKTYDVVTDYNGIFTLPINLSVGQYIGQASYDGTTQYQASTTRNTITVNGE